MRRTAGVLAAFCLLASASVAQENYAGGNGSLVSRTTDGSRIVEIRKLEIASFKGGDWLADKNTIYDGYDAGNVVGQIEWWREPFSIHHICSIESPEQDRWGQTLGEMWLEISTKKLRGWLCCDSNFPSERKTIGSRICIG